MWSICFLRKSTPLFSLGLYIGDAPVRRHGSSSFCVTPLRRSLDAAFRSQLEVLISLRFLPVWYLVVHRSFLLFFRDRPVSESVCALFHWRADSRFRFWSFVQSTDIRSAPIPHMPTRSIWHHVFFICFYQQISHLTVILSYLMLYYYYWELL